MDDPNVFDCETQEPTAFDEAIGMGLNKIMEFVVKHDLCEHGPVSMNYPEIPEEAEIWFESKNGSKYQIKCSLFIEKVEK